MREQEPSGPIQTAAPGLLELLQLKNQGRLPSVLIDSAQGVIDLLAFYLQSNVQVLNGNLVAAAGAITINSSVFPASNENRFVHEYSVYIPVGAATTDLTAVALTLVDTNNVHTVLDSQTFPTPLIGANRFATVTARNFWRPRGTAQGSFIGCNVAGTNLAPQFSTRFTPLS